MPSKYAWDDETEPAKQEKRDAADRFLRAVEGQSSLVERLTKEPDFAREQFRLLGQIDVPDDVEVRCLEPDHASLSRMVVFALLDPDQPAPYEPWPDHWLAYWHPFFEEWRPAASAFLLKTQERGSLRDDVLQNRDHAREQFAAIGGITVPNDLEVICLESERRSRARLVLLKLLPQLWKENWLAGWQPYR